MPVHDAATVVLLRDSPRGIEAWLLTRVHRIAFASGMTVFPGGRVDAADASLPWVGRSAAEFAGDFGCPPELAAALVGASIRETFEETGVLLTAPPADLSERQPEVEAGTLDFGTLLREHGLAIDADRVRGWARWVTPEGESRRYDTRFFVALLPDGAQAADLTTESSVAAWVPIAQALAEVAAGERPMLPPTTAVLRSLLDFATVADVLAAAPARSLAPVAPRLKVVGDAVQVELPDGTSVRIR